MRRSTAGTRERSFLRRYARCGLALGLVLAGCGASGYNTSELAKMIRGELDQHRGFHVRSVSCPKQAKLGKNVVIRCTATLAGGRKVNVRATQLDAKGTVHVVIGEMFADNVERGIVATLAQRGITATAVCPEHVLVVVGKRFDCTVSSSADRYRRAVVSIVDSDGGFRVRFF